MTITRFQQQLKKANPRIRVRCRGRGDICGVYIGDTYVARFSKGELYLNGFRAELFDPTNPLAAKKRGNIVKRGRKTLLNLVWNRGGITSLQKSKILWGKM